MPSYIVRCEECNLEESHVTSIDQRHSIEMTCGHVGQLVIKAPNYHPFRSGWYEHIASEPIHISSRRELREACEKHGVYSRYLEDSPVGSRQSKREV